MVRLILAVVVGFTSVAALPVCENSASGSGCPINKGQCCNVIPRPFALGCAAKCCEVLANEAAPGECPNFFNAISEVGCECAVDETDVPTAEPTPSPAPTRAMKTDDGSDRRVRPMVPKAQTQHQPPRRSAVPLIRERPEKNQTKTQNKIPRAVPLPRLAPP